MTAIRTSPSGPIVDATELPPGDYDGEPLIWNGSEWGPQTTIRVLGIQGVTPAGSVQIGVCESVLVLPTGDFAVQANGNTNYIVLNAAGSEYGVSAGQTLTLSLASVARLAINDDGIGFFGEAPVSRPSITGVTEQQQIDSLVAALTALGLATDDR